MKKTCVLFAFVAMYHTAFTQGLPDAMKLPDFIQPTPEVSALLKADNLSVNNATGSPNINIPIGTLAVNGINLPISLSYNSTGVKADEYSTMVGTGWNCSSGGVVSRTIFDKPDESRDGSPYPTNLSNPDFAVQNAALLSFLKDHPDAESDVFNFSFLNYSGKFILDSNLQTVIPLSNYNVVIKPISNYFPDGFIITTDDGTTYRFDQAETSKSRNPMGTGCPKSYEASDNKTSWYLSKITAPNKRSYMNFTYLTQNILFEQSISQYLSKCIATDNYPGACGGGPANTLNAQTFYTCVTRQLVSSKFISKIITSAGDTAAFYYDSSPRQDLDSAKRLSQVRISNRNGQIIKQATLYGSYNSGNGSSAYTNSNKRLYLDSLKLDNIGDSLNSLAYVFQYLDKSGVSARLSYLQDWYGFSNGKSSNASLIPILPSTDMNYTHFSGGSALVTFGDRSIDTVYAMKGLLNKIIYPTGGYDSIIYRPNRYYNGSNDSLIGGSSVSAIQSYSFGQKVLERSFLYKDASNHSSTFLITGLNRCSDQTTISKDGLDCNGVICEGPAYTIAHLSSNLQVPLTTSGSQHAYHRNVIEKTIGGSDNGYTEHHYVFFNGGNVGPYDIAIGHNNKILSAPLQIVNDVVLGEDLTRTYRYDNATSSYKLQRSVTKYLFMHNFVSYYNYVIKKNFLAWQNGNPPLPCEFNPYDVTKYAINKYDVYTDSTREVTYDTNNDSFIVKTTTDYANALHSYPTKLRVFTPDGDTLETRKAYPLDGSASVLTYRNIVAPVLEEKHYKNGTLLSTITNTYKDWFSDSTLVVLQKTAYKEQTNSMPVHINYINYDTLANVLELAKDSGVHKSYIWGYKKQLPIAVATNAAANEIFYTGFEEVDGTTDAAAKTGGKSHNGNYSISFSLPNAKSYLLTYWSWDGSKWLYYETAYTGPATITATHKLDEVRVFPADAQMQTYTYEPMLGITGQCDVRNQVSYYEYDALNRLKLIRDEDGKILKLFDYKYQQ